jgi:SAM-dependent methyltransferase
MLAPRNLPAEYGCWNQKHRAPLGSRGWLRAVNSMPGRAAGRMMGNGFQPGRPITYPAWLMRRVGPFAFQANSLTRAFEYPWAYHATPLERGMKAVELGAGASGFQFVLAGSGVEVVSVDPLLNPSEKVDWVFAANDYRRINEAFGGKVRFVRDFLENAKLEAGGFDRVFAISVIEHVPEENALSLMREIARILKPGGLFVCTIDLFLDCHPFTERLSNIWGRNISVGRLVEASGLTLRLGERTQLLGHPEFDPGEILKNRDRFLLVQDSVGGAQVMTQCLVLEKPRARQRQ